MREAYIYTLDNRNYQISDVAPTGDGVSYVKAVVGTDVETGEIGIAFKSGISREAPPLVFNTEEKRAEAAMRAAIEMGAIEDERREQR